MGEKTLVILIVLLTAMIMGIFSYRAFKNKSYCSKCKKNKNKRM